MKKTMSSYILLVVGTFFMAMGVCFIYEPMSMVTGGFSGAGIIIGKFLPVPLGLITFVLNLPLFLLAQKEFGSAFLRKTLFATVFFSAFLELLPALQAGGEDYLMAALVGGTLNGAGLGIVMSQRASTGGSDLLSSLIHHWFPNIKASTALALIDGVIVGAGMLVFGASVGMYSVVAVFVTSKVIDRMIEGLSFAKMLYIISGKPEEIAEGIMRKMDRGVTSLQGRGMYSGADRQVLLCAVSRKELVPVLQMVRNMDERAFVIISDAREVMGEGFDGK